jgi:hypothetical protein
MPMPNVMVEIVRPRRRSGDAGQGERSAPPAPVAPVMWTATLTGEPLPRGAAREIAFVRGVPRSVPTQRARVWQRSALAQLVNRRPLRPFASTLVLECRFWHGAAGDAADDSDVIELLERAAVIASRRQVREKHLFAGHDALNPRTEVALRRVYCG